MTNIFIVYLVTLPTTHYTVRRSGGYSFRLINRPPPPPQQHHPEQLTPISPSRLLSRPYESYPMFEEPETATPLRPQPIFPWQSINYIRPPVIWVGYPVSGSTFPPQFGSTGNTPVSLPHWTYPGTPAEATPVPPPPPPVSARPPVRWCRTEGLQPHPTDCRRFVRCHFESSEGVFVYRERICPHGLAWDQEIETCNYISQVPACQQTSGGAVGGAKGGAKIRPTIISSGPTKVHRRPILVAPLPLPSEEAEKPSAPERVYIYEMANHNNNNNFQPEQSSIPSVTAPSFYTTESDEEPTKGNGGKSNVSVFVLSDRHQPSASQLVGEGRKSSSAHIKRSNHGNASRSNLIKPLTSLKSSASEAIAGTKSKPANTDNKTQSLSDHTFGAEYELHAHELDSSKKKKK